MQRFLVSLTYDGSSFSGWQKNHHVRTVQTIFEQCLALIAKQPIKTIGSSRTDAGVHALSQYVHFDFPINLNTNQLHLAIRTKLPKDIKVNRVYSVSSDFHCRFDAVGRSYLFKITKDINPFNRLYKSYFPRHIIHTENIRKCLHLFVGEQNFEHFCHKDENYNTHICDVKDIDFQEFESGYTFSITANRFLHNMVRRIIGTMIKLSEKENMPDIVSELLKGNHQYLHLIYTAPPHGLYLTKVIYPEALNIVD